MGTVMLLRSRHSLRLGTGHVLVHDLSQARRLGLVGLLLRCGAEGGLHIKSVCVTSSGAFVFGGMAVVPSVHLQWVCLLCRSSLQEVEVTRVS